MPEVAPVETLPESPVLDTPADAGTAAAPATPEFDEATYKKRIAGYTSAINQTKAEKEAIQAERDALAAWRREREQADMTEAQKLAARVQELEAEASAAKAQAAAATLAAKYPRAAALLGDDLARLDATRVAEIDGQLAKEEGEASAPAEPRVDPNSPGRRPAKPVVNDQASARAALVAAGNPFFDDTEYR